MQRNLLNILSIILILLATNQCKCGSQPVYDTINLDLQWKNAELIDIPGLDLKTANGLTCRVPSENAAYFINAGDGKTYKFTQAGGKLECQSNSNVTPFNLEKTFVFAAGSMQKQNLYLGSLQGGQVTIQQLEEGVWKQAISQNVATLFPESTLQEDKFIVACSLQIDGQQQGCILFIHQKGPTSELGCLLFDPAKKSLTKVTVGTSYSSSKGITKDSYLIGALGIKPGKILLGKGYYTSRHKDTYDILQIEANTLELLSKDFRNNSFTMPAKRGNKTKWELFSMVDRGIDPATNIPMFTFTKDNNRSFFKLSPKSDFQQLTPAPIEVSSKPSWVIPLGDNLYLITTRPKPLTEEEQNAGKPPNVQQEEIIYYQAQLVTGKEESSLEQSIDK